MSLESREGTKNLGEAQSFEVKPLGTATLPAADREALLAFQKKTARLQRAVLGASRAAADANMQLSQLERALQAFPQAPAELGERRDGLATDLAELRRLLDGDSLLRRRGDPSPPSITSRVQGIIRSHWNSTSAPTETVKRSYDIAAEAFGPLLAGLQQLIENDLASLLRDTEAAGAPWTPGRVPRWQPEG